MFFAFACQPRHNMKEIIHQHQKRYPRIEEADAMKIVYQAAMGIRHLLDDTTAAKNYLFKEIEQIEANPEEPLFEIISPDNSFVRVNLKNFKARGLEPDKLFKVMLLTADEFPEDEDKFFEYFEDLLNVNYTFNYFNQDTLVMLYEDCRNNDYSPIHHTKIYKDAYKPAYRVVNQDIFEDYFEIED